MENKTCFHPNCEVYHSEEYNCDGDLVLEVKKIYKVGNYYNCDDKKERKGKTCLRICIDNSLHFQNTSDFIDSFENNCHNPVVLEGIVYAV